jgi:hypothetical protein
VNVDREKAGVLGLTETQIAQSVLTSLVGSTQITPMQLNDPRTGNAYNINVRLADAFRDGIDDLSAIPLKSTAGGVVTLDTVASIERASGPVLITRKYLQRIVDVTANVAPDRDLGSATSAVQKAIDDTRAPEGFSVQLGGQSLAQQQAFAGLGFAAALAIVLVYMVLASQFKSLIDPLVIMFSVPLGVSGVFVMLYVTGTTLSVNSFMGIIMMVGIVVSNGVLLIDFANVLRRKGMPLFEATIEAGRTRLRPILMTTIATIVGLIPMALGIGEGSESNLPLARAVIGGLTVSTFFTLFLVPALYTAFDRFARRTQYEDDELELREEARIVLEEQANVADAEAKHREALDADAEREAGVGLGVEAAVLEHRGVNHPAAEHLHPARALAHATTAAAAEDAAHVDLGAGLDEREVARAPSRAHVRPVEPLSEGVDHALELGKRDVFVDEKALDLVEHRRVRDVVVATEHGARADDGHRRLARAHLAHLDRARVGTEQHACIGRGAIDLDPERVLHVGRRVIGREGELGEVVLFELDLGAVSDDEAERPEDLEKLVTHLKERVSMTTRCGETAGHREVERARVELGVACGAMDGREPRFERRLDLFFEAIHLLAEALSIVAGHLAHLLQDVGEHALLAQHVRIGITKLLLAGRGVEPLVKVGSELCECLLDGLGRRVGGGHDARLVAQRSRQRTARETFTARYKARSRCALAR